MHRVSIFQLPKLHFLLNILDFFCRPVHEGSTALWCPPAGCRWRCRASIDALNSNLQRQNLVLSSTVWGQRSSFMEWMDPTELFAAAQCRHKQLSMLQGDQIIGQSVPEFTALMLQLLLLARKQTNFDSETEWELDATSSLNPTNQDEQLQFHIFYLILYIYPHWLHLNAFESCWKKKGWLQWSCGPCSPCPTTVSSFCGFFEGFSSPGGISWQIFAGLLVLLDAVDSCRTVVVGRRLSV